MNQIINRELNMTYDEKDGLNVIYLIQKITQNYL